MATETITSSRTYVANQAGQWISLTALSGASAVAVYTPPTGSVQRFNVTPPGPVNIGSLVDGGTVAITVIAGSIVVDTSIDDAAFSSSAGSTLVGPDGTTKLVRLPGVAPRDVNIHAARLGEPMKRMEFPTPYTFTNNVEFAYGTPIYIPEGFNGYVYWAAGAPYPTGVVEATVTITIASPAVVTHTAHGFPAGAAVILSTTGALPTGLAASTIYYVAPGGLTTNTYQLSVTPGGASINTSGTQSGTQKSDLYAPKYENPCIYASNDGETWVVPSGLTNPIFSALTEYTSGVNLSSYYADPYITLGPNRNKLYCIWIHFRANNGNDNALLVSESSNGVTWSRPVEIFRSTDPTLVANSPSLFYNGSGWTMVCVDTRDGTGTFAIKYMTTASTEPYTGWSALSTSTAVNPYSRNWWHCHFVPIGEGVVIGMGVDNNSAGGAAYTFKSTDGCATFSVQRFGASSASAAASVWYRPSLCVASNGVDTQVLMYSSMIGPYGESGFHVYKAGLKLDAPTDFAALAATRDQVTRKVMGTNDYTGRILAFDSFVRADSAVTLGNADSGGAWTAQTGTLGISTNRWYNVTTGNNISTLDVGCQDYDIEAKIDAASPGNDLRIVWAFQDTSNFMRLQLGTMNLQRVEAGAVAETYSSSNSVPAAAGDVVRVVKQGKYFTIYINDRPLCSVNEPLMKSSTLVGLQASGVPQYVSRFIVRVPS